MYERYRGERVSAELLCRQAPAVPPAQRAAEPRFALIPLLAACLLIVSVLVLFFQVRSFLGHMETRMVTDRGGDNRLRAIGQQVEVLRGKLHGALAESVEIRLRALEKNIDAGKLGSEDFKAFDDLQKDLKRLEDYAESSTTAALDYGQRDHGRFRHFFQPSGSADKTPKNPMMRELADLKTLFYFCLAGLGTSTAMMVGYYWVAQRREVRRLHAVARQLPVTPRL